MVITGSLPSASFGRKSGRNFVTGSARAIRPSSTSRRAAAVTIGLVSEA